MSKRRVVLVFVVVLGGCAADAEPFETDVVVTRAGLASPAPEGTTCLLRMQPAWRSGVNCQVRLTCGDEDLFGGRRVGGYAVCDTDDGAFASADDGERVTDGDPSLHVDVAAGTIRWAGPHDAEEADLRFEGEARATPTWE
jgi:hypothetical protein